MNEERPQHELTDLDRQLLAFERQWWKYAGAKEAAIVEQLGVTATRYYQLLNALIDRPEALEADPLLVRRLQRLPRRSPISAIGAAQDRLMPAAGDGTGQRGHVTPRHVWVNVTGGSTGNAPGILLDWRVADRGKWEAYVIWADGGGNIKPRAYVEWVSEDHVRPRE